MRFPADWRYQIPPTASTTTAAPIYMGSPILFFAARAGVRLLATDGHLPDQDGRRSHGRAEFQVRSDLFHVHEHLRQIARDADLGNRIRQFAVLDPQA